MESSCRTSTSDPGALRSISAVVNTVVARGVVSVVVADVVVAGGVIGPSCVDGGVDGDDDALVASARGPIVDMIAFSKVIVSPSACPYMPCSVGLCSPVGGVNGVGGLGNKNDNIARMVCILHDPCKYPNDNMITICV